MLPKALTEDICSLRWAVLGGFFGAVFWGGFGEQFWRGIGGPPGAEPNPQPSQSSPSQNRRCTPANSRTNPPPQPKNDRQNKGRRRAPHVQRAVGGDPLCRGRVGAVHKGGHPQPRGADVRRGAGEDRRRGADRRDRAGWGGWGSRVGRELGFWVGGVEGGGWVEGVGDGERGWGGLLAALVCYGTSIPNHKPDKPQTPTPRPQPQQPRQTPNPQTHPLQGCAT